MGNTVETAVASIKAIAASSDRVRVSERVQAILDSIPASEVHVVASILHGMGGKRVRGWRTLAANERAVITYVLNRQSERDRIARILSL